MNSYIHLTVRILRKEPMNLREGVSKGLNRRFWMEKREERDDLIKYLFEKLKMCVKIFYCR